MTQSILLTGYNITYDFCIKSSNKMNIKKFLLSLVFVCYLTSPGMLYGQEKAVHEKGKDQNELLTIVQTVPGNIFYEKENKTFIVHTSGDLVSWVYYDFWNNEIASGSRKISGKSNNFTVNPGKSGWFKLMITAKKKGQIIASKETSFAVVSDFDLSKVGDSPFMVQTHAAFQSTDTLIPIAQRMGVKYIRDIIRWDAVETKKQVFTFNAKQDNFMSKLAHYNLKPYFVTALYNALYDKGLVPVSSEATLAFANYVKEILNRYPAIKQIEIWNEPDIGSFSKGIKTDEERANFSFNLLKASYEKIHPLFPDVKITGFVLGDQASDFFINSMYKKGALKYMDEYSFHSYTSVPENITRDIDMHKHIMELYNNDKTIPINLSETGFTTFTFTETEQAVNLSRRIVTALAQGISKVGVYILQNKSIENESEGRFGLIRHPKDIKGAYVPKPAFVAYAALTRQLTGAKFEQEEHISPGIIYSYKFIKGNEEVRFMYSPSGTGVKLHTSANIEVTDLIGAKKSYKPVNGIVHLILDKNPLYVKGTLKAPFVEEEILKPGKTITLNYGFYIGGYTEFPKRMEGEILPDSIKMIKWRSSQMFRGADGKKTRVAEKPFPGAKATWEIAIATPGLYNVSAFIPADSVMSIHVTKSASYKIYINGVNIGNKIVDQYANQGKWVDLGKYDFARGNNNYVELEDASSAHDRPLRADGLKLESIPAKK